METTSDYFYEREVEYFGMTPFQLTETLNGQVTATMVEFFNRICGSDGNSPLSLPHLGAAQSESGLAQWTALVESRLDRNYELFELYVVKNVLYVPDDFIPPHRRFVPSQDHVPVAERVGEISALMGRLKTAQRKHALLLRRKSQLQKLSERMCSVEEQHERLRVKLAAWGPFEEGASKLHASVQQLQSIANKTIVESRHLASLAGKDSGAVGADERVGMEPLCSDMEGELARCNKIATLSDLSRFSGQVV